MTRDEILSLFARRQEAWRRRDAAALAADHTEDCTLTSPMAGIVSGRGTIENVYDVWFTGFPDFTLKDEELVVDEHVGVPDSAQARPVRSRQERDRLVPGSLFGGEPSGAGAGVPRAERGARGLLRDRAEKFVRGHETFRCQIFPGHRLADRIFGFFEALDAVVLEVLFHRPHVRFEVVHVGMCGFRLLYHCFAPLRELIE